MAYVYFVINKKSSGKAALFTQERGCCDYLNAIEGFLRERGYDCETVAINAEQDLSVKIEGMVSDKFLEDMGLRRKLSESGIEVELMMDDARIRKVKRELRCTGRVTQYTQ